MIRTIALTIASACLVLNAHAAPILVTNGSFEQGAGGIGSFAGWTTSFGDASTFVDSSGKTGNLYGQASDGLWAAYFGSTAADGGASISQTIATTQGRRYELSFDLANDNGGAAPANSFVASINGLSLFSLVNGGDSNYTHIVESFFATGPSTLLQFSGSNDLSYVELDRVAIAAVPEPAEAALVLTGALMMGAGRRRRTIR